MNLVIRTITRRGTHVAGLCMLLGISAPAHAYIDPGTGSMLIQLAAASVAGALFFLRDLRHRIVAWFSKRREFRGSRDATEPAD